MEPRHARLVALATALAACGGAAPASQSAERGGRGAAGSARLQLTVYRDGVVVRERHRVDLPAGRHEVDTGGVAASLVPGTARLVAGPGGPRAVAVAAPAPRSADGWLATWIGESVEALVLGAPASGIVRAVAPDGLVLETADEASPLRLVSPEEVSGPAPWPRLRWTVEASAPVAELTTSYAARGVTWRAAYTAVLDGGEAALRGAVSLANHSGADFDGAAVDVIDAQLQPRRGPAARRTASVDDAKGAARRFHVSGAAALAAGERVELAIARARVPAKVRLVYDAVGDRFDTRAREPIKRERYGLEDAGVVVRTVELDLAAAGVDGLPQGQLHVFRRGEGGALEPLGSAAAFGSDGAARVAFGRAPEIGARRERTDFSVDERAARAVEEFRVHLDNRGTRDATVIVREHMYRGLNWALAYHNATGAVVKEGDQLVSFEVDVPAGGEARLVYRVVYTW